MEGGGGDPKSNGGTPDGSGLQEEVGANEQPEPLTLSGHIPLDADQVKDAKTHLFPNDPTAERLINDGNVNIEALVRLSDLQLGAVRGNQKPSNGPGGPGKDGGSGDGARQGDWRQINQRRKATCSAG